MSILLCEKTFFPPPQVSIQQCNHQNMKACQTLLPIYCSFLVGYVICKVIIISHVVVSTHIPLSCKKMKPTTKAKTHTNVYHAMTSCHRALVVDAGSFSGYLWSILMGGPRSYCPFMKLWYAAKSRLAHKFQEHQWKKILNFCMIASFILSFSSVTD